MEESFDVSNRIGPGNLIVSPAAAAHGRTARKGAPKPAFVDALQEARIRMVQRQLCLTGKQIDGVWGPRSQRALDAYRMKRAERDGKPPSQGGLSPDEFARFSADANAGKESMECP
jgi:hypothetical protein